LKLAQFTLSEEDILSTEAWLLKDTDVEKAYKLAQQAVKLSPELKDAQHTLKIISEKRGL